jgi:adenylosuccinate lyase
VAVALAMREKGQSENDLLARLAADERLPAFTLPDPLAFTGAAGEQVRAVIRKVDAVVAAHPDAAAYTQGAIL